jgi:hypothetical protein
VNDDFRLCLEDRVRQGFGLEHVDQDRVRAEASEKLLPFRRTRRSPHRMAGRAEKRGKPPADDAGRAC